MDDEVVAVGTGGCLGLYLWRDAVEAGQTIVDGENMDDADIENADQSLRDDKYRVYKRTDNKQVWSLALEEGYEQR